jgi:hypothetical protein
MDHSPVVERQILHDHPQATQPTIQLREDGRLSLTTNTHNYSLMLDSLVVAQDEIHPRVIVADNAGPQGASSSMQGIIYRLLAALQAEGYGNNMTIGGKSTNVRPCVPRRTLSRDESIVLESQIFS